MKRSPFFALGLVALGVCVHSAWAEYTPKGKRDPFVPLLTADGQKIKPPGVDEEIAIGVDSLALQGIVFDSKSDSYAIINGHVVREQDNVEGMKILKIQPTTVTILVDGRPHEMTLHQPTKENETKP